MLTTSYGLRWWIQEYLLNCEKHNAKVTLGHLPQKLPVVMMAEKTGQMCEPEQLCGKYRADCLPF